MNDLFLPRIIQGIKAPPVKCQGIKTKLVPFIARNIRWDGEGRWVEPFMGSGVVAFNIRPNRALLADTNKHIIGLYNELKQNRIDKNIVKQYLLEMGAELLEKGEDFYYQVREEFNQSGGSLPFLFLNRSCFNGLMRFNSRGNFNVPFGKKPERFRQAYITKIVNQIAWVQSVLHSVDWEFVVSDYKNILHQAKVEDFVYMDPPYIGRHTDYFNSWSERDAVILSDLANQLPCGFALSMWLENRYRRNAHIDEHWQGHMIRTYEHFYHVGSTESLRNSMTEALVIKDGFSTSKSFAIESVKAEQQAEIFSLME